jgi:hypothetical protein
METNEQAIHDSTKRISRLYHDNIDVNLAIKSMQNWNVSAEFVRDIYMQLSKEVEKLMTDRFHYHTLNNCFYKIEFWTSRYLIGYNFESSDTAFHEIKIIDLFSDRSM